MSAAMLCVPTLAAAADTPRVEGELLFEANNLNIFESDDPDSEINDLYGEIELAPTFVLTDTLSIGGVLKLERVTDPDPGDDTYFENLGAFVEELYLSFANDRLGILGGKFNPAFGLSFDAMPGVFAEEIGKEDIELAERIGFSGHVNFGSEQFGQSTITASVFFADTTELSNSVFDERGRVREIDGGASNTEDLSSYAIAWDVENVAGLEGLHAHLAYRHQEAGLGDFDDDDGIVAALYGEFELANGLIWRPFVEYADLNSAGGAPGDRRLWQVASTLQINKWRLNASYVDREIESQILGGSDFDDQVIEVTAGYDFDSGLSLDFGYLHTELEDIESDGIVAKLTYAISF